MRQSIRTRLILSFAALTVLPLLVVGIIIGVQAFTGESSQAVALQQQIAGRSAILVSNLFDKLETELRVVADQPDLLTSSTLDQSIKFAGLLSRESAFNNVFLLDDTGQEQIGVSRVFAITPSDLVSRAQLDEYTIPMSTGKLYYSPVYTDKGTGEPVITLSIPIINFETGKPRAILVANLRFVAVQNLIIDDIFSRTETGIQNTIYMVDVNNQVVAHNDPSVTLRGVSFTPLSRNGVQIGLRGDQTVLATEPIKLENETFTIVAETPVSRALALAYNTVAVLVLLIVIALVVSVLVGFGLVNQIVRPILALAKVAQSIQQGDLSQRADVTRQDEIGSMAVAFNGMTDQLQQTLLGLQSHVEELEKARVEREKLIKDLQGAKRLAEENSRLKSEFLSTMSHELRTPLNAIEGFTGIILNKIGGTDFNPKTEGYMQRISSNSKRLLQLINDFLDLSRVEAGRLELADQPFSPETLAKRWQSEIAVLAEKKGLKLEVVMDSAL
ncbi:MAG TPA: histidine kinase dimerization/phospho-acceptor domain-containing protein, partial [Phototrophicaceae bacterium]|nr:histidine kinase dimerization/phospho-acceptor domain-containing protein [Phototrophicaceae bacterium]